LNRALATGPPTLCPAYEPPVETRPEERSPLGAASDMDGGAWHWGECATTHARGLPIGYDSHMKNVRLVVVSVGLGLVLAACSGKEIVAQDAGGSGGGGGVAGGSGSGGSAGVAGGGGSSGSPSVGGSPEAGTSECDDSGTCVLCSDDRWHCPRAKVYSPACPPGRVSGSSCADEQINAACFECTGGGLIQLVCHVAFMGEPTPTMGKLTWESAVIIPTPTCSP
jgi:hypothetical protein